MSLSFRETLFVEYLRRHLSPKCEHDDIVPDEVASNKDIASFLAHVVRHTVNGCCLVWGHDREPMPGAVCKRCGQVEGEKPKVTP